MGGLLASVLGAAGAQEPEKTSKRYGPLDVELRLCDGSRLRAALTGASPCVLDTPFGQLTIPVEQIRALQFGDRLSGEDQKHIAALIKDLDSDDFQVRQASQARLEAFGRRAIEPLNKGLAGAGAEGRTRIQAALKKIVERGTKARPDDCVTTHLFAAKGRLHNAHFSVKTKLGEFKVSIEDVESMRFLAYGTMKELQLQGQEALFEWVDTGLDIDSEEEVALRAGGMVNIHGNQLDPNGSTTWGTTRPFLVGQLIGRWGNGPEFAVNTSKQMKSPGGRLYLKMWSTPNYVHPNNKQNIQGEYKVTIATGSFIEEMGGGKDGGGDGGD
jgi:hypothetical protein